MCPPARRVIGAPQSADHRRGPRALFCGSLLLVWALAPASGQVKPDDPLAPYLNLVQQYRVGGLESVREELPNWPIDRVELLAPLIKVASRETVAIRDLILRSDQAAAVKGYSGGTLHQIEVVNLEGAAALALERAIKEAFSGSLGDVRRHIDFGRWLLDLVPGSPAVPPFKLLWYRAAVFLVSGLADPFAADEYLKKAEGLFPGDPAVALARGAQLELLAIPPFSQRLIPVSESSPRPERLRQMTLRQAAVLKEARRTYEAIVASDPHNAEAWLRLALLRCRQGELDEGNRAVDHAVREATEPRLQYLAALVTGAVRARAGDWDGAAGAYRMALAAVPNAQAATFGQSEALLRLGRRAEAAAALRPILAAGPHEADSDPWWEYPAGPFWRLEPAVEELRERIRP